MDCNIVKGNKQFRLRAAALIVKEGKLLMARNTSLPYYYSVGGGIGLGESSEQAVLREVYEETGWKLEIDRLALIHESFFQAAKDGATMNFHMVNFYYLMKTPENFQIKKNWKSKALDSEEWVEWVSIKDYEDYYTNPKFLGEYLRDMPIDLQHIKTETKL